MPFPIAAAAIMAGTSLIGNALNSAAQQEAKEEGRAYLRGAQSQSNSAYNNIINGIGSYYDKRGSLGNASDAEAYRQLIAGYSPDEYTYMPGKFEGSEFDTAGDRSKYINPYYQQIIGDAAAQVQHSAAGAGVGRGSGAAQAIATEVAQKDNELWKEANQEYKDERNFQYNQYSDYIKNMQDALAQRQNAMNTKLTLQGNLANDYYSVMDAQQSDKLKALQDQIATNSTYSTAMAGLY